MVTGPYLDESHVSGSKSYCDAERRHRQSYCDAARRPIYLLVALCHLLVPQLFPYPLNAGSSYAIRYCKVCRHANFQNILCRHVMII